MIVSRCAAWMPERAPAGSACGGVLGGAAAFSCEGSGFGRTDCLAVGCGCSFVPGAGCTSSAPPAPPAPYRRRRSYSSASAPAPPPVRCGESTCENHGYDRSACEAVGCCQFEEAEDIYEEDQRNQSPEGACWYDGSGCSESVEGEAMDAEDPDACREWGDNDEGVFVAMFLVLAVVCLAWPLIFLSVACCACIQPKKRQGQQPTPTAWASCVGVFLVVCVAGNLFVPAAWLWGPCFMIIPFCCVSCYTEPPAQHHPQPQQPYPLPGGQVVAGCQVVTATVVTPTTLTDTNPLHPGPPPPQSPPGSFQQPAHVQQPQVVLATAVLADLPTAPPASAAGGYRPAAMVAGQAVTDQVQ